MLYFIVLSNSSTIFNITLELNFHIGKSYAIANISFSLYIVQYTVMYNLNEILRYGAHW